MTRGSQLQIRLYVNRYVDQLNGAIKQGFPDLAAQEHEVRWRAPLERDGYAEPRDNDFLIAIERPDLGKSLGDFWPLRGPVWDALAVLDFRDGKKGVLLVEGKSHPKEVYGGGCRASLKSREMIERAFRQTQEWLGVQIPLESWLDPLRPQVPGHSSVYQSANRYAHLYWLREAAGVEAWLIHLLFVDDPTYEPTSLESWKRELPRIERDLGLAGLAVPNAGHVFLSGLAG